MAFRVVEPGQPLGAARGDAVVCVPVYEARALFEQCLRSVAEHTDAATVLVADDASTDPGIEAFAHRIAEDAPHLQVIYARQPVNAGFVRNVNDAFAAAAPADVVILNSDVVVPPGWLERLRAAALSDALVATASTLTNHGTILSVPERSAPNPRPPAGHSLRDADRAVAEGSPRLRPRIPTGIGHCLYVRRSALDLAGSFDESFSPGYGEEVDFSQRCLQRGLVHVVADDVFVFHRGEGSFGGAAAARQVEHETILAARYPYYHAAVLEAASSERLPLARSIAAAKLALTGLSVTVDGAALGPYITGTQLHVLELVGALVRHGGVEVRVRVPRSMGEVARDALAALGVETFLTDEDPETLTDVAHRPFQVVTPLDVSLLRRMGRAVVLTQQDLIAFHNPAYFPDYAGWHGYRELARDALAAADRVAFFSAHAAREAIGEDLVEPGRARVVHIGVDHQVVPPHAEPRAPAEPADLAERPFLLCIGTDFLHKNRPFALEVLRALRERHGFGGRLVFAGPEAAGGTSREEEAAWRARHPGEAEHVVDLGPVEEPEKTWVYANAALVVYPTVREGFGLVPFEAAEAGTATLWAAHSSLAELLPEEAAGIVPWDAEATAERAATLLADPAARAELVEAVRRAAARYRWDTTAARMVEVYREAATAPLRGGEVQQRLPDLAVSLVGPGGWIPPEVQQALLAVSTRPGLRRPVFGALVKGYRAFYKLRRAGTNGAPSS